MTDEELRALLAELARKQAEDHAKTEEVLREEQAKTEAARRRSEDALREERAKTEEVLRAERAKTDAAQRRTEETLRRVTKQLGGLGNKFGSFTEGLAFDSMRRILKQHFGAEVVSSRTWVSRGARSQEFDMVGVRNGAHGEVYLVEIKSELNPEELKKTLKKLRDFFEFMPHLKGMKLYGIIAAVDVRGALADRVPHEGLYLATAGDENFKLVKPPPGFKPKVFTAKAAK